MTSQDRDFAHVADTLLKIVHDLLDSSDARARVRAIHHLATGVAALEHRVLLVPHVIRLEDVPSSVGRGAPDVIPGFLLARLALSEDLHGDGHGGELLAGALETTLDAIRLGGGRVIVVDAIDDRARGFYEHFGFRSLPLSDDRLVMKASTAATSLSIDWPWQRALPHRWHDLVAASTRLATATAA